MNSSETRMFIRPNSNGPESYFVVSTDGTSIKTQDYPDRKKGKPITKKFKTPADCQAALEEIESEITSKGFIEITLKYTDSESDIYAMSSLFSIQEARAGKRKNAVVWARSPEILDFLSENKIIEEASITFNTPEKFSFNEWNWEKLSHLKSLKVFVYGYPTSEVFRNIESLSNLKILILSQEIPKIDSFELIGKLKNLEEFAFSGHINNDVMLSPIFKLGNLKKLSIGYDIKIKSLDGISALSHLKELCIQGATISKKSVLDEISTATELEVISLGKINGIEKLPEKFSEMPALELIVVSSAWQHGTPVGFVAQSGKKHGEMYLVKSLPNGTSQRTPTCIFDR